MNEEKMRKISKNKRHAVTLDHAPIEFSNEGRVSVAHVIKTITQVVTNLFNVNYIGPAHGCEVGIGDCHCALIPHFINFPEKLTISLDAVPLHGVKELQAGHSVDEPERASEIDAAALSEYKDKVKRAQNVGLALDKKLKEEILTNAQVDQYLDQSPAREITRATLGVLKRFHSYVPGTGTKMVRGRDPHLSTITSMEELLLEKVLIVSRPSPGQIMVDLGKPRKVGRGHQRQRRVQFSDVSKAGLLALAAMAGKVPVNCRIEVCVDEVRNLSLLRLLEVLNEQEILEGIERELARVGEM